MTSRTSNWRSRGIAPAALTLLLAAGTAAVASQTAWPVFVRVPAAALLVLVLPGYALTRAALGRAPVGWAERVATTLGLSLAIAAIGGVVFQFAGLRADLVVWIAWLVGATAAATAVALARDIRDPGPARDRAEPWRPISAVQGLLLFVAATITVWAMIFAWAGATVDVNPTAVQLWILPVQGTQPPTVRLGIHNEASNPAHYRLVLTETPTRTLTWTVDLAGGQVWETTSVLDGASVDHAVTADLFDDSQGTESIRSVSYWNTGVT
jgi:hypothetical protein